MHTYKKRENLTALDKTLTESSESQDVNIIVNRIYAMTLSMIKKITKNYDRLDRTTKSEESIKRDNGSSNEPRYISLEQMLESEQEITQEITI